MNKFFVGLGTGLIGGTAITWFTVKRYFNEQFQEECARCPRRQSCYLDIPIIPEPGEEAPKEETLEEAILPEMPRSLSSASSKTRTPGDIRRDLEARAAQWVDYHNYTASMGYNRGDKPTLEEMDQQIAEHTKYETELAEREYPDKPGYSSVDEDPDMVGEEVFALPPKGADGWRPPYPISEEEFAYGGESHEKVTIMYFCEDDTLMDTDESTLNIDDTVGRRAIDQFEEDPDIDIVYARNEKLGLDYEITRNWGSYNAMMEADDDMPPHRKWR